MGMVASMGGEISKTLALQQEKRELADAILTEENSLLARLTSEDLAFLLR